MKIIRLENIMNGRFEDIEVSDQIKFWEKDKEKGLYYKLPVQGNKSNINLIYNFIGYNGNPPIPIYTYKKSKRNQTNSFPDGMMEGEYLITCFQNQNPPTREEFAKTYKASPKSKIDIFFENDGLVGGDL